MSNVEVRSLGSYRTGEVSEIAERIGLVGLEGNRSLAWNLNVEGIGLCGIIDLDRHAPQATGCGYLVVHDVVVAGLHIGDVATHGVVFSILVRDRKQEIEVSYGEIGRAYGVETEALQADILQG